MFVPTRLHLNIQSQQFIIFFLDRDNIARSYIVVNGYIFLLHRSKSEEGPHNVKLVEKMQHLPSSTSENLIMRSSLRLPCAWYDFFYSCLELSHPLYFWVAILYIPYSSGDHIWLVLTSNMFGASYDNIHITN